MQFVYKPEGAPEQRWDFDPNKIMNVEAEAIEKVTGMTYARWTEVVTEGSVTAVHALLWVLLKRRTATLRYDQVTFSMSEVDFELDDDETLAAVDELDARSAAGEQFDADTQQLYDLLRPVAERLRAERHVPDEPADDEPTPGDDQGKVDLTPPAVTPPSEPSVDGSSPTSSTARHLSSTA